METNKLKLNTSNHIKLLLFDTYSNSTGVTQTF